MQGRYESPTENSKNQSVLSSGPTHRDPHRDPRRDHGRGFLVPTNPITALWVATPPLQYGIEIAGPQMLENAFL